MNSIVLVIIFITCLLSLSHLSRAENPRQIYGIMVCRDSHWTLAPWLQLYAGDFEKLVILDGSGEKSFVKSKSITKLYPNVLHLHEAEVEKEKQISLRKTDNSLRGIAWSYLNKSAVLNNWVVIAHPDEFYPQKFIDIVLQAEKGRFNQVRVRSFPVAPFLAEKDILESGINEGSECFNILSRVTRCNQNGTHMEQRIYKYFTHDIQWTDVHRLVVPEHFPNVSISFHIGFLLHFKIHNFDEETIDPVTGRFMASAWSGISASNRKSQTGKITKYSMFDSLMNPIPWLEHAERFCRLQQQHGPVCKNLDRLKQMSLKKTLC